MLILPADADEALVTTAVERITRVISPSAGEVGSLERWGRKRFAYEIADQTEGYYVVVRFRAEPATQQELDRALKLADEVIRHKVLVPPTQAKAKAAASPASAEA
jgi:small subunit ribosomal protein S6